jgi:NAD(P)-dependent dehydrogenase (short-subunit alcohol dehydrogenase family)
MKVAVTGASGFIGGHVVAALCEAGHTVRCLVRPTSDVSRIAHLSYERVEGDVLDAESVKVCSTLSSLGATDVPPAPSCQLRRCHTSRPFRGLGSNAHACSAGSAAGDV